jgi:hypothetical protein
LVLLTTMSTLRLPQCEQRNHSLQSGTVVAGAISLGWPRVGLDLVAAPHDQPRCTAAALPSVIAGPAIELQRPMPVPARNARTSRQIGAVVHLRGSQNNLVRAVEVADTPLMPFARDLLVRAQGGDRQSRAASEQ